MRIDIISIFPGMFDCVLNESILKRAQKKGLVEIRLCNLRDYSQDKHRKVDDRPFGGGPGMVMRPQPIFNAAESLARNSKLEAQNRRVILLSPQGERLTQKIAQSLTKYKHLILICGRYEGVDERVREFLVDEEISIGDYILTGGELAAMVLVDCIVRLLPGALGDETSALTDSFTPLEKAVANEKSSLMRFTAGLLEYPQYTRPADFRGMKVPSVLLSGDHKGIERWRKNQALRRTKQRRPDLLKRVDRAIK